MFSRIFLINVTFIFLIVNYLFFISYLSILSNSKSILCLPTPLLKSIDVLNDSKGWISSSLFVELNSYISRRDKDTHDIKKTLIIINETVHSIPLDSNYITFLKGNQIKSYPYSRWKCWEVINENEYCLLNNIYYDSSKDKYYYFKDPLESSSRDTFVTSYGDFKLNLINEIEFVKSLNHSSILIRPNLISEPLHENYAHSFLETCGPRFWVLSQCQSYINPENIQIYYTSDKFNAFPSNWNNYLRQSDGSYLPKRQWEQMIQSMFSIYPLLTFKSFNKTNILFQSMFFTGHRDGRTPVWGHFYQDRPIKSYPFPTIDYRRAYLAFSEWILNNFNLNSKFELTFIQQELQKKKIEEEINMCDHQSCSIKQQKHISLNNQYSGEWIVVVNRRGIGRREITNADQLISALLKLFPDHSNPYLRVWPKQLNFDSNLYSTARMARSIRLLIGVHGAGLSNTLFMRPGAIIYEINPYGCRHLSFNFQRWAQIFNLQHALWIPSQGENERQDNICQKESNITLNVKEIVDEVKNLINDEIQYRNGFMQRALQIINHSPNQFENIFETN